jgi:hypothetical protein
MRTDFEDRLRNLLQAAQQDGMDDSGIWVRALMTPGWIPCFCRSRFPGAGPWRSMPAG